MSEDGFREALEEIAQTYPYRLYCNKHRDIGRVGGPGAAHEAARKHEREHGEDGGYVMVWEDGG